MGKNKKSDSGIWIQFKDGQFIASEEELMEITRQTKFLSTKDDCVKRLIISSEKIHCFLCKHQVNSYYQYEDFDSIRILICENCEQKEQDKVKHE